MGELSFRQGALVKMIKYVDVCQNFLIVFHNTMLFFYWCLLRSSL